ncbi:MAG: 4-hydroxybutyrate CoA-transferase [Rhodospirillum sp.]|nr:4-hydroxybutyrate CoA-transferase [Rhodospirillum sp.]MCF8489703.1 4-hydroxybutyrate CoA-transferase [Rhodospirillum sp.]MCF8501678.1 4-hydroxybutyrate CoA-transferase [Rhodospirillum sp.]
MTSKAYAATFDFPAVLKPGDWVSWPQGTGEPLGLTRRLMSQLDPSMDLTLFTGLTAGGTVTSEDAARARLIGLNGLGTNRVLVATGGMDIIPTHISEVPALLRCRRIPVTVALIRVRPTEDPDLLSCGVVADYTRALVDSARVVVAELDERLPLTRGDALIPRKRIHHLVARGPDEILMPDPDPSTLDMALAARVAALIPDRATVQLGIGGLSAAISRALMGHRELGIHGGVISDVHVDLVEAGVVTDAYKGIDPGQSVTGCLFGTRRLMAFADNNSALSLRSVEYTHAPAVLSRVRSLHSVNSAVEVDLSGQVNAERAGDRYVGAIGGQVDFVRGARLSSGGRSIIALASTAASGTVSRIVPSLSRGVVTTARSDVDAVVTEHGIAELKGVPFAERARRLVAIADPRFRGDLLASLARTQGG